MNKIYFRWVDLKITIYKPSVWGLSVTKCNQFFCDVIVFFVFVLKITYILYEFNWKRTDFIGIHFRENSNQFPIKNIDNKQAEWKSSKTDKYKIHF